MIESGDEDELVQTPGADNGNAVGSPGARGRSLRKAGSSASSVGDDEIEEETDEDTDDEWDEDDADDEYLKFIGSLGPRGGTRVVLPCFCCTHVLHLRLPFALH